MKKLLQFTVLSMLAVLTLGVTSCKPQGDSEGEQPPVVTPLIDFRNKKSDGTAFTGRSARAGDVEFKSEFIVDDNELNLHSFYKITKEVNGDLNNDSVIEAGSNGEESKAKLENFASNVKITNHEEGFQVEFTAPEDFAKLDGWDIAYIDNNGNKSTGVVGKAIPDGEDGFKNSAIDEDGKLTAVYPLVLAGQKAKFLIHLFANNDETKKHWEAQLYYSITPENGLGCVDDLPKAYDSSDYLEIVDGHILKISKTVPPMAKNLKRAFYLVEQDKGTKPYGENDDYAVINGLGFVLNNPASEKETDACKSGDTIELTIDLKDYLEYSDDDSYIGRIEKTGKDQSYIFAFFNWTYTLDDYPDYTFGTPQMFSKVVENTVFVKNN